MSVTDVRRDGPNPCRTSTAAERSTIRSLPAGLALYPSCQPRTTGSKSDARGRPDSVARRRRPSSSSPHRHVATLPRRYDRSRGAITSHGMIEPMPGPAPPPASVASRPAKEGATLDFRSRHGARRGLPSTVATLALISLLAACGGGGTSGDVSTASESAVAGSALGSPTAARRAGLCDGGRLTVGDLVSIDKSWNAGVADATARAREWRGDAQLVQLSIGCRPLEPALRWQGTFYSREAQSFFLSDTGQTEPAEVEPTDVPILPTDQLSFRRFQLSLARAGYAADDEFGAASGVSVRLNTAAAPFGPPGLPPDVVIYHVAIDNQGEVRDLFVSSVDWTIRSYPPGG